MGQHVMYPTMSLVDPSISRGTVERSTADQTCRIKKYSGRAQPNNASLGGASNVSAAKRRDFGLI